MVSSSRATLPSTQPTCTRHHTASLPHSTPRMLQSLLRCVTDCHKRIQLPLLLPQLLLRLLQCVCDSAAATTRTGSPAPPCASTAATSRALQGKGEACKSAATLQQPSKEPPADWVALMACCSMMTMHAHNQSRLRLRTVHWKWAGHHSTTGSRCVSSVNSTGCCLFALLLFLLLFLLLMSTNKMQATTKRRGEQQNNGMPGRTPVLPRLLLVDMLVTPPPPTATASPMQGELCARPVPPASCFPPLPDKRGGVVAMHRQQQVSHSPQLANLSVYTYCCSGLIITRPSS
jgi:hypothetical protein